MASGATMPQRPPASIDMLHRVMRPSIDSAAMALPANSMAWPCAPSAPIRAMIASAISLAPTPAVGLAVDRDAHALRLLLPQRLRHQHMRHLGGADAEGVGAERAVRGGVAVAADDREARQGQPLLRADHMDDALARIAEAEQCRRRWPPCWPRALVPSPRSRGRRSARRGRASAHNDRRCRR